MGIVACLDGPIGPTSMIFVHVRIETHGVVHNVDRKIVNVKSTYDMHRLLWPFSLSSLITTCTEYRHPFLLSHVWPNSPYYHSFILLEIPTGDLCICIERVADGL